MKLETEFRICLQRQMLEQSLRDSSGQFNFLDSSTSQSEFEPSTWVELLITPGSLSFNQALLLCQCATNEWLAWVPDYGEIMLHTQEFRLLSEDS